MSWSASGGAGRGMGGGRVFLVVRLALDGFPLFLFVKMKKKKREKETGWLRVGNA
jgi:hypothetical protein